MYGADKKIKGGMTSRAEAIYQPGYRNLARHLFLYIRREEASHFEIKKMFTHLASLYRVYYRKGGRSKFHWLLGIAIKLSVGFDELFVYSQPK